MFRVLDFPRRTQRMSKTTEVDPFWAEKPSILWQQNRLSEFVPAPNMSWSEMLNSIVRGAALVSLVLAIYFRTDSPFYILLFALILTYIIAKYPGPVMKQLTLAQSWLKKMPSRDNIAEQNLDTEEKDIRNAEFFVQSDANKDEWKTMEIKPTTDNPFMNFNIFADPTNKPAAPLSYSSPSLQADIEKKFQNELYRDVSDLYNKQHGQREFYTTPSTTFPNDQTSFARWLYATPPTCKEEGIRCIPYDNNPVNPISTSAQALFYPTPVVPTVQSSV